MTLLANRDFLWVAAGRVVAAVVAIMALRVATYRLSPDQYGHLTLLITFQMFCGLFLINPVGLYINRHTFEWWDDGSLFPRLRSYRAYVLISALIGGIMTAIWGGAASDWTLMQTGLASLAVFFMVLVATWNATSIPLLNMLGFRSLSVLWAATTVVMGLFCSWFLTYFFPTATAWFAGQASGMALGAIGAGYTLRRDAGRWNDGRHLLMDRKVFVRYCLPLAVATFFMWIQVSGYRLLLNHYWGLALLGYAAVGLGLASQLWNLCESLAMQYFIPLFYRRVSTDAIKEGSLALSDLVNVLGPLYLVLTGANMLGANLLVALLVDPQYAAARWFVSLGAIVECCRVLSNMLGNAAHVTRTTRALILPYVAGSFTIGLFIVLAGIFQRDVIWAGAALACGGLVLLVIMAWQMYLLVPYHLDGPRWLVGLVSVTLSFILTIWFEWPTATFGQQLGPLMVIGGMSIIFLIMLVWKNPAVVRMLAVRLR